MLSVGFHSISSAQAQKNMVLVDEDSHNSHFLTITIGKQV